MVGVKELSLRPPVVRRPRIDLQQIATEYEAGTCTQRELARQHGVCVGTIQNWLKRHRAGRPARTGGWVEVLPAGPRKVGEYRIELPSGRVVVLAGDWDAARVRELVEAVSAV